MSAGLTCEVYVDGVRLADTDADYTESVPTALAGLGVTWGRATVVDQPDASSCTFTVGDIGGDADFLGLLHVGHVVDVYAAGSISSGTAPVDVVVDGSFETATIATRVLVQGGTAAASTLAAVGKRAIRVDPNDAATAAIPPAAFSTSPTAWNPVPQARAGESWSITLRVSLGGNVTGTLAIGLYPSPTAAVPTIVSPPVTIPPRTDLAYQTITVVWTVPAGSPQWLGAVLTTTDTRQWLQAVGTWAAQTQTWQQAGTTRVDDLHVMAPPQAQRRTLVFSGRITDLAAESGASSGVEVSVTAADGLADLGNDYIGDVPWLVETVATRVNRIVGLAASGFSVDVDAWPGGRQVTWVDIDSQPASGLISDLATTVDAVMWSGFASNRGFYLWLEDPAQRQAMALLVVDGGSGLVVIVGNPRPAKGVVVSACDLARDVQWTQDVSDVLSIVDLTWLEQLVDDQSKPAPTERHVVLTDPVAVDSFGQRRLGYETQLINATDGSTVANRLLTRSRVLGWRASGASWDTDIPADFTDTDRATALTILDGAKRIGLPISLTDMPDWTPEGDIVGTYLEGGSYTYEGGRWRLDLNLSPAGLTGQSIQWKQVNAGYRWRDFDPSVRWVDMYGVGQG